MKRSIMRSGVLTLAVALTAAVASAPAQQVSDAGSLSAAPGGWSVLTGYAEPSPGDLHPEPVDDNGPPCSSSCLGLGQAVDRGGFYGGADYLLIRPHFSEAVAFARGTQGLGGMSTEAEAIRFDYESAFRAFGGYQGPGGNSLQFTVTHLDNEDFASGTVSNPGEFIVDPFGNLVGAVMVINPADPRFGTVLVGGDLVRTETRVELNYFDIDFITPVAMASSCWSLDLSAGVRIADVDQYYESVVSAGGVTIGRGDYSVDFTGAGPRVGLDARRYFGHVGRFSILARAYGSLLLGSYDVQFSNSPMPGFIGSQTEEMTRLIPVLEGELGVAYRLLDSVEISGGWLFQSWWDLGTSGGTFGGYFSGADDGNIMSYDGLFLRAEVAF